MRDIRANYEALMRAVGTSSTHQIAGRLHRFDTRYGIGKP